MHCEDRGAREREVENEVTNAFRQLEEELVQGHPGVLDVLRVYGAYEDAIRQAEAYFAALDPIPTFSTSNTSGC